MSKSTVVPFPKTGRGFASRPIRRAARRFSFLPPFFSPRRALQATLRALAWIALALMRIARRAAFEVLLALRPAVQRLLKWAGVTAFMLAAAFAIFMPEARADKVLQAGIAAGIGVGAFVAREIYDALLRVLDRP